MSKVRLAEVASERTETDKGNKSGLPIVGLEHLIPEEATLGEQSLGGDHIYKIVSQERCAVRSSQGLFEKGRCRPF